MRITRSLFGKFGKLSPVLHIDCGKQNELCNRGHRRYHRVVRFRVEVVKEQSHSRFLGMA